MHTYEDIDRILQARGYIREGVYDRTFHKNTPEGVRLLIMEHELANEVRYSVRGMLDPTRSGLYSDYEPTVALNYMKLEVLFSKIEEIEVGIALVLPQLHH
jgi:hypothetical protein